MSTNRAERLSQIEKAFFWKEGHIFPINEQEAWARVDFGYDTFSPDMLFPSVKDMGIEVFNEMWLRDEGGSPKFIYYFVGKIGGVYTCGYLDKLTFAGKRESLEEIGKRIQSEWREEKWKPQEIVPLEKRNDTWVEIGFPHDSFAPYLMKPALDQIRKDLIVESSDAIETFHYYAKVGVGTYLRAMIDRVDIVGKKIVVNRVVENTLRECPHGTPVDITQHKSVI